MKVVRWSIAGVAFGLALAGSAPSASAGLDAGSSCSASATFRDSGVVVDAATADGVITVKRSDTVTWEASVPAAPGKYSGSLTLALPPPFGEIQVKSWAGDSQATSNSGTDEYNLPKVIPGGMRVVLSGRHVDANGVCSGTVTLSVEGSPMSSPITWASLGGTAATGIGVAFALRPLFGKVM